MGHRPQAPPVSGLGLRTRPPPVSAAPATGVFEGRAVYLGDELSVLVARIVVVADGLLRRTFHQVAWEARRASAGRFRCLAPGLEGQAPPRRSRRRAEVRPTSPDSSSVAAVFRGWQRRRSCPSEEDGCGPPLTVVSRGR